ncbi:MAG: S8 family serine peptidase [Verrucomicrobiales bacterium]|nr:S8 family serine peptidase [Verrucomicrobiales bacterium]
MKFFSRAKIALVAAFGLAVLLLAVRHERPRPEAQTDREISSLELVPPSPNEDRQFADPEAAETQRSSITLVSDSGSRLKRKDGVHRIPLAKRALQEVGLDYVNNANLTPRKPLPKGPLAIPEGKDLEITVKFQDALLARATSDGALSLTIDFPIELSELNLGLPIGFRPAFDAVSKKKLQDLQKRAAERSGANQADFEGTVVITIPKESTSADRIAIAKAFHGLGVVEYVELVALDNLPPPPADIAPPTPDLESFQGYRNSEAASGGGNVAYAFSRGIKGQGIRLSDCEYGFNASHEDLVDSDITDSSRGPFHPTVVTKGWDKHGTAALGISGATENGYGVTGIAPLAEIHFYSEWTENGARRRESVTDAIADSGFGDVVLLEMQTGDGEGNYVPAEYNSTIWNLVKAGSDAGVIVVAAAGNGGRNLDDAYFDTYHARGDSGSAQASIRSAASGLRRTFYETAGAVSSYSSRKKSSSDSPALLSGRGPGSSFF